MPSGHVSYSPIPFHRMMQWAFGSDVGRLTLGMLTLGTLRLGSEGPEE